MPEYILYVSPEQFYVFKQANKDNGLDVDAWQDGDPEPTGFCGYPTKRRYFEDEPSDSPPVKIRVTIEEVVS